MDAAALLLGSTARSLCLAAAAGLVMRIFRVESAAARHAVWTAVVAGMLLSAPLTPLLPPLPLRVLPATVQPFAVGPASRPIEWTFVQQLAPAPHSPSKGSSHLDWLQLVTGAYAAVAVILLLRLSFSYLFTRRLVRASRRADEFLESDWIAVPMTVGWLRPKILLPAGWRDWEPCKLEAALAHERAHIHRADWAIAALAALNRCVFWFNPIAWWLERRLAVLAEQACDDAALLATGAREAYAQTLLEIAAAVRSTQGRLNWEALAMTRPSEVRERIERILDEARWIPRGLVGGQRAAIGAGALAAAFLLAALQLAPARTQQQAQPAPAQSQTPVSPAELVKAGKLSADEVAQVERPLAANPEKFAARSWSILDNLAKGENQRRAADAWSILDNLVKGEDQRRAGDVPDAQMASLTEHGPEPIKRVDPTYLPLAAQARLQGTVRLRVLIAMDGTVKQVEVINGHPLLINAACDAVKQWVYPPQELETLVEVEVPFRLPNDNPPMT